MAKKEPVKDSKIATKKKTEYVFVKGGHLSNGKRFEAGRPVPADLPKDSFAALVKTGAIKEKKNV